MSSNEISGIVAYTVTPFSKKTGQVELKVLFQTIDQLIASGADAIASLGSAGECAYLDNEEWELVAKETIEHVNGSVPVIVGIAELTTKSAVKKAIFAQQNGADAIMVSPWSYYKLSEGEIFDHYAEISSAISIPIMVYNNPATCGVDMSAQFMLSMVNEIENITMIKESTGDIQRMHKIFSLSQGTVPFFNGCNHIALEALNAGAQGWCTVAPNLIGDLPKKLLNEVKHGNVQTARDIFYRQLGLLEFIVKEGLASSVKAGLEMRGIEAGTARRPLKELAPEKQKILKQLINSTCEQ